jgi:hypothetical protein
MAEGVHAHEFMQLTHLPDNTRMAAVMHPATNNASLLQPANSMQPGASKPTGYARHPPADSPFPALHMLRAALQSLCRWSRDAT